MCGIAGFIGKFEPNEEQIFQTLNLMKNRGPDHQAYFKTRFNNTYLTFLHSRLSIIDLDARSHQPFSLEHCTLIYNGEIYNYVELRNQLKKQGIEFKTTSDTEVLLQSYLLYGPDCVKDFEGMWSFALFDKKKETLFLSRDRFAEKPLYYFATTDGVFFGSEVKFLKSLSGKKFNHNEKQLLRYYVYGYKSLYKSGETFFEGVYEVPPATNGFIGSDLKLKFNTYWKPQYNPQSMTIQEAVEATRFHLEESVRIRLRSDVPLAFCLSGGMDSSALVSIAAKKFNSDVSTFTIIDEDERYNEYENVDATLSDLKCKNTLIKLKKEADLKQLSQLIEYHDAPIATITYYIHSFLSRAISEQGYKVVFSGTAADELFTGYYDHFILHLYEVRNHPDFQSYLSSWQQYIYPYVRNPYLKNPYLYFENPTERDHIYFNSGEFVTFLKKDFHEPFIEKKYTDSLLRNRMMNEIFEEATRLILHEDDLNSMMYSIENRSPYLDKRLFEFAYSIPSELLIQDGYGKFLLRQAVKGVLNDKVRLDRQKKGFNASIHSIIDFESALVKDRLLSSSKVFDYVKRDKLESLLKMNPMPNSHSKFLFNFINMKLFLEQVAG